MGLVVALAVLPLLIGIGLLLLGRIWGETRRMKNGHVRMALAADLDLKPRELAELTTAGLLKLRDQVAFDDLTGVLRRVAGVASLDREIHRARRSNSKLVAAFVDLDGLKQVNDTHGHAAGDTLIRGVAMVLQEGLRKEDLIFRYGGDEFVCMLPGIELELAEEKLKDLRARARQRSMLFSFGLTELRAEDDLVSFLGRADQTLYDNRAKRDQELEGTPLLLPTTPPGGPALKRSQGPKGIV